MNVEWSRAWVLPLLSFVLLGVGGASPLGLALGAFLLVLRKVGGARWTEGHPVGGFVKALFDLPWIFPVLSSSGGGLFSFSTLALVLGVALLLWDSFSTFPLESLLPVGATFALSIVLFVWGPFSFPFLLGIEGIVPILLLCVTVAFFPLLSRSWGR